MHLDQSPEHVHLSARKQSLQLLQHIITKSPDFFNCSSTSSQSVQTFIEPKLKLKSLCIDDAFSNSGINTFPHKQCWHLPKAGQHCNKQHHQRILCSCQGKPCIARSQLRSSSQFLMHNKHLGSLLCWRTLHQHPPSNVFARRTSW